MVAKTKKQAILLSETPIVEKKTLQKEISALKGVIKAYKKERKVDWNSFKTKTIQEIDQIYKTLNNSTTTKPKK